MTKKTIIVIGAIVLVLIIVAYVMFGNRAPAPSQTSGTPTGTLPISQNVSSTSPQINGQVIDVTAYDGTKIIARDFIHHTQTTADVENPGSYMLAGNVGYCLPSGACPTGAPTNDYTISYNINTDFFNIALLKEPIGDTRQIGRASCRERV